MAVVNFDLIRVFLINFDEELYVFIKSDGFNQFPAIFPYVLMYNSYFGNRVFLNVPHQLFEL